MGRLRILADGPSAGAQAQARGKLFEKLMAQVLSHYGYSIDAIPSVNYSGMEIDIEGKAIATGIPLYAECKCYENEVDAPKLQAFYGKYTARWKRDPRCHGLFIALPGVNSHAKGFYRDNCENDHDATVRLYEERDVLEALFRTNLVLDPHANESRIPTWAGTPGDWTILYTSHGFFWIQYVIPPGEAVADRIMLFSHSGQVVTDRAIADHLTELWPELADFVLVNATQEVGPDERLPVATSHKLQDAEEIVEVAASSACFEYQFPSAPEHFIGRLGILEDVSAFANSVVSRATSCRGLLFEGNSGWGKSSLVLSSVARLESEGHFALAVDSRSASSSQFILRVIDYALRKYGDFDGCLGKEDLDNAITGFDGAIRALIAVGRKLALHGKLLIIFLDQFENVFYLHEALRRIRDVFLKVCDEGTNVVFGFSWKTDLIGLTSEFPYQSRDALTNGSKRISLVPFSEAETSALLHKLSLEIRSPLRKDLEFFLSEFSQGYPWLLKKLCAHVKAQREGGVPQSDLANSLLNVEELFKVDLRGLSPHQEDALRRIAKAAPVNISDLGDEFKPDVVQSLVDARLIVRIGTKYDIYWDIFRDYLNSGQVPAQENYILRVQAGRIGTAAKILAEAKGSMPMEDFQQKLGLRETSLLNVLREMRVLGIAQIEAGDIHLLVDMTQGLDTGLRLHLRDHLRRNRLVRGLLEQLEAGDDLPLDLIAQKLAEWTPYTIASAETWRVYARVLADWMDAADLAILDPAMKTLKPMTEVRERRLISARSRSVRSGNAVPRIQYKPIEKLALRIFDASTRANPGTGRVDTAGYSQRTVSKVMPSLIDLGFISVQHDAAIIQVNPALVQFVMQPDKRAEIFAFGALQIRPFREFVQILEANQSVKLPLIALGNLLAEVLGTTWKQTTAETTAKILLDWARHAKLAPGVYSPNRLGAQRGWRENIQRYQAGRIGMSQDTLI